MRDQVLSQTGLLRWRLHCGVAKRFLCPRPRPGHWRLSCPLQDPLTRETYPSRASTSTSAKICLTLPGPRRPHGAVLGALAHGGDFQERQLWVSPRALLVKSPPPLPTRSSRSARTLACRMCHCRCVAARFLRGWHSLMTNPEMP